MKLIIECEAYEIANLLAAMRDRGLFANDKEVEPKKITNFIDNIYKEFVLKSPKPMKETPEAPAQTGASSIQKLIHKGRPKNKRLEERKNKIIKILSNSKKHLSLPEINDLLGVPEENYSDKARTRYVLDILKKEKKISIEKVKKNEHIINLYYIK